METFLLKALQLVAALSLLVAVHEFGHYLFARIFGIRVEKFYLFFNPGFSLVQYDPARGTLRLCTWTDKDGKERQLVNIRTGKDLRAEKGAHIAGWRETIYGLGWLPLGGYCKIAGMIDESMDKEQLAKDPEEWEFRSRPAYQRLLVMIGGVLFNFITAIVIYIGIAWHWGAEYIPFSSAYAGFDFVEAAKDAGFRNGDIPYDADGKILDAADGDYMLKMAEAKQVRVIRNNSDTVTIDIPENFIFRLNDAGAFMAYRVPVYVANVLGGQPAAKAGIMAGDHIVAVDETATPSFTELTEALSKSAGKSAVITVERDGKPVKLTAEIDESGKLGFQLQPITEVYETVRVKYDLLSSVPKGWELGTGTLTNYVGSMKHLFSSEGAKSIGGFGALGNMFPERWNWYSFWQITAFLSVALAFMNIIPIPALDGGHVMFLLYEVVTRRKPSEKVLEWAQYAGMAFLLLLLLYANGMDLFRAFAR